MVVVALAGCGGLSSNIGNGGGGNTTYTIGGAISGLSATGLVLANGSDTVSPAANANSFVFPTAESSGSSYSVTVSTQPTGETCTVTNGSGTVGSSNVSSVQVACTASGTYTIGGTISGLTATGLVLANGTDTVSPAANATTFVFSTAVASGANYAVTVSTQPTGETCTVTNGSGTVGSSNVTNVQVACAASTTGTYTIGGTISGLTATGLVLANGSDTVSPAANATTFVFPTAVVSGATYSVGVSTQPTGETCTVTNGSGTVGSSNVTNVQVACAATGTQTFVPLVVTPAVLPGATSGTSYSQALTGSGTGPFTWSGYTVADNNSTLNTHPNNDLSLSQRRLAVGHAVLHRRAADWALGHRARTAPALSSRPSSRSEAPAAARASLTFRLRQHRVSRTCGSCRRPGAIRERIKVAGPARCWCSARFHRGSPTTG